MLLEFEVLLILFLVAATAITFVAVALVKEYLVSARGTNNGFVAEIFFVEADGFTALGAIEFRVVIAIAFVIS